MSDVQTPRSLAHVITVLGLAVYWAIHAILVVAALHPIALAAARTGKLAKESLELSLIGIFAAPFFLLLDAGDLLNSMGRLFWTCMGLLCVAGVLGALAGGAIRIADPYGVVSDGYVSGRTCIVGGLSCLAVAALYPRYTTTYIALAVPALLFVIPIFWSTLRRIAYPRVNYSQSG